MTDDDDELDAAAPFLAHDWRVEGVREVGGELRRCTRCGALGHWPAAHATCSLVLVTYPVPETHVGPMHAGQWPGPYAPGILSECAICSRQFRRPVRNTMGTTCGKPCARENKRRTNLESNRLMRERKRAQQA